MSLNKEMGDAHEEALYLALGGRQCRASGSTWKDPADGRNSHMTEKFAFAWDGKSTFHKSISVSVAMWQKIVEQAAPELPMLGLRYYDPDQGTKRLAVTHDLVVMRLEDAAELIWHVRRDGKTPLW